MTFGLEVYKATGQVLLSSNDKVTRLVYSAIIPANSTGSISIPGYNASVGVALSSGLTNRLGAIPHQVTSSGNTVYWQASSPDQLGQYSAGTDSLLLVFMYG